MQWDDDITTLLRTLGIRLFYGRIGNRDQARGGAIGESGWVPSAAAVLAAILVAAILVTILYEPPEAGGTLISGNSVLKFLWNNIKVYAHSVSAAKKEFNIYTKRKIHEKGFLSLKILKKEFNISWKKYMKTYFYPLKTFKKEFWYFT